MTSTTAKHHLEWTKSYIEELQHEPDDLASPMSYRPREDDKQPNIDVDLLDPGDHRYIPIPLDGQASPILYPQGHHLPSIASTSATSKPPPRQTGIRTFCASQWRKHKAPVYVFGAQFFGALMNLFARLLEVGDTDTKLHPMQLLLWRMLLTSLTCSLYITWKRIPHGVLGSPEVRPLLVPRGIAGFFGIYGMWYSIQYCKHSSTQLPYYVGHLRERHSVMSPTLSMLPKHLHFTLKMAITDRECCSAAGGSNCDNLFSSTPGGLLVSSFP